MKKLILISFFSAIFFNLSAQKDTVSEQPIIVCLVDQMPSFIGGESEMMKFIQRNISYPFYEKKHLVSGTVYVTFVVDTSGSISQIKILRGVIRGPGLDNEAIRVIRKMPKWNPGKQNGKVVNVQFNLPIKFTINSQYGMKDFRSNSEIMMVRDCYNRFNDAIESNDTAKYKMALDVCNTVIPMGLDANLVYCRAMCYIYLGNKEAACADFSALAVTGISTTEESNKYCK
ncbi:hypothetical protein BH10BAC1_BH10BAC1_18040 [soil metagenome]